MDIYEGLDAMRGPIHRRDWTALDGMYRDACSSHDPEAAAAISSVSLGDLEAALASQLGALGDWSARDDLAAVYWEFDPDNGWESLFFPCLDYAAEAACDDEWAADFDGNAVVRGPSMPDLARLFDPSWDRTPRAIACNLYLIGRTLAAFGRAADRAWTARVPLCAGYHDQEIVFRVAEPA